VLDGVSGDGIANGLGLRRVTHIAFVLVAWADFGPDRDDRIETVREIAEFSAIAFGVTGLLHGSLVALRLPFSSELSVPGLLYGVGLAGPTLAAIIVEQRHRGRSGVRDLLSSGHPRTISRGRGAAAVVAQPLMMLGAARISGRRVRFRHVEPLLAAGQLWVVAGEEFGWRGFVWPHLHRRLGPVKATLALATMWGLWHLPMFFVPESLQAEDNVLRFGAAILAWSFLHSLLQLDVPSVATAMLLHAATNLSLNALDIDLQGSGRALTCIYGGFASAATMVIVSRRGRGQGQP
jgi:uncharacterized protein